MNGEASGCPAYCSPKQTSHLGHDALTQLEHLDIVHVVTSQHRCRRRNLVSDARALQEEQLSPSPQQRSGDGNELDERTHGASGDLIEWPSAHGVLRASAQHRHVRQTKPRCLVAQPIGASLHRLDERHRYVGSSDREHQTRQARTAPYVGQPTAGPQVGRDDSTVDDMPRPKAARFERTNEPELLAVVSKISRESTCTGDLLAEYLGGACRFDLDLTAKPDTHAGAVAGAVANTGTSTGADTNGCITTGATPGIEWRCFT